MWEEHKARLGLSGTASTGIPTGVARTEQPEPAAPETSLSTAWGAARELYGTVNVLQRWQKEQQVRWDPNYKLESNFGELMKDVPTLYQGPLREQLVDARSAEHSWAIRDNFMFEVQQQEELVKQGWKGGLAALAAGVADETSVFLTFLGPTAALARAGKVARALNLANKGRRIGAYAIAGAAENASIEALTVAASHTRSPMDVGYAAAFGGLFGAGAGHFMPAKPHARSPEIEIDLTTPDAGRPHSNAVRDMDATIEANARGDDEVIDSPATTRFSEEEDSAVRQMVGEDPLPDVRALPIAEVRDPARAKAAAAAEAEQVKLEGRLKELADEEVLEPVRPTLLAEIDKAKAAMAKAVDPETLDPKARVRQQQDLTKLRRHVMTVIQKEDPDTYAELGLGRNPSAEDFKLLMDKGAKKLVDRVEKAYKKDLAQYEARLTAIDKELGKTRSRLQQLAAAGRIAERGTLRLPKKDRGAQGPSGSLGAAATGIEPRAIAQDLSAIEEAEFATMGPKQAIHGEAIRKYTGTYANLMADPSAAVRWLTDKLLTDHVGGATGTVSRQSANVMKEDFERTAMAVFTRDHKDAYNEWMKAQGIPLWQRKITDQDRIRQFGETVTNAIEGFGDGLNDPNVMKAVAAARKLYKDAKDWGERAGVEGFDQFATDPNYTPHIHNSEAARDFRQNYRLVEGAEERMQNWSVDEEMVYQGLRRSDPELDPETAALIARNYMDIVIKKDAGRRGQYFDMSRIGEEGYIENMWSALGLDKDDMQAFLDLRARLVKPSESERVKYARRRTALDMRVTIPVRRELEDGTFETTEVALKDMFHRDVGQLAHSYIRSVGGRAAIAEATKGTAFHITSDKAWADTLEKARQFALDEGLSGEQVEAAVKKLDMVYQLMVGIPVYDVDGWSRVANTILRYNFVGRMGQTAFAQLSEMGNLQAQIGTINMIRMIPEMARFYSKRGADGRFVNELARFAEEELAAGADAALGKHFADHITDVQITRGKSWLGKKGDDLLHTAERVVGYPMRKVLAYQQRMLNIAMLHNIDDIAQGRKAFFDNLSMQRWRDVGLTDADMEKVVTQFNLHARHDGDRLLHPNPEAWDDYNLWLKFRRGMFRMTRRSVQENDISNLPTWLHKSPLAKLAVQFRTFQIGAIEKQLMYNTNKIMQNPKDLEAWLSLSYQTMWAGLAYTAMIEGKALLKDESERAEFREKYLTLDRIAAASFARAGYSTLIPGTADTTLWIGGADPVFSLSRGSGLQQNFITGNPTVQLSSNVMKAARGVVAPIVNPDYQFSRQDLRAWQSVLPFSTLPGVYNLWNAAPQLFNLPESSSED